MRDLLGRPARHSDAALGSVHMQVRFISLPKAQLLAMLLSLSVLASCVTTEPSDTNTTGAPDRLLVQAGKQSKEGNHAGASSTYEQIAQKSPGELKGRFLLRAAHESVAAKDTQRAQNLLNQAGPQSAAEDVSLRAIVVASIALLNAQPNVALSELSRIPQPLPRDSAGEVLELKTRAQFALRQPAQAIGTALDRERLSSDVQAVRENRRLIWQGLRQDAAAGADFTPPPGANAVMRGWLALGRVALAVERNPFTARAELTQWQSQFGDHPANEFVAQEVAPALGDSLQYPTKIALLLPLSGKQQAAGIAVRDGFLAALYQQEGGRPLVSIYDSTQQGVVTSYRRAITEGAQFIVGPLVKEDVAALANSNEISVPTLALNNIGDADSPPAFMYQFSLDPEEEARQIAARAIATGRLRGIALLPNNALGQRLNQAFSAELAAHGGALLGTRYYAADTQDFSAPITDLLLTEESRARKNALASRLGTTLEFEARARGDVGFVFIAGTPAQGRSIRPALRFSLPASLPIFATSDIFEPDEAANADLEGLMFTDMPWVVSPDDVSSKLRSALTNYWPRRSRGRARLYAFGFDAYRLVPALKATRPGSALDVPGMTGRLSLDDRGHIHRQLDWAQIVDGQVKSLDATANSSHSN
jgi:outer membrane PBP1 activator LpoA protein